uniref:Glycoside hydrolase family 5 domain-containing protein n=1 Tax=uncultured bacterium contig00010 TaxID=1181502 RepID=A0A806JYL3_9BACT|nr:hypothetical protein [uncultured bacterium contig00010]
MKNSQVLLILIILLFPLTGCKKETPAPVQENTIQRNYTEQENLLRIKIVDNEFTVNGNKLWINGANAPWHHWNEFGNTTEWNAYDDRWWDRHFAELKEAGINAARVWINCNNDNLTIDIDRDGTVYGVSGAHWNDLDLFFKTVEKNQIYIMATLLSFDHFKNTGNRPAAQNWRNMLTNKESAATFVENYTMPFVERYRDNPWLWSIDLINEPDWIFENEECGKIPWENISYFIAINAAAIHENSNILVTVGMAFPKYNSDFSGYEGNKISDAFLQQLYPNENAYVDFWSPHYYDWVGQWFGVPFYLQPYGRRPDGWGLHNTKPAVIGEVSALGTAGNTLLDDYKFAFRNGWHGIMPWTSNGVDEHGSLHDFMETSHYMLEHHGEFIFP